MTVAQLIAKLQACPDQSIPVVFTYPSEVDGDTCITEVENIRVLPVHRSKVGMFLDLVLAADANIHAIELF